MSKPGTTKKNFKPAAQKTRRQAQTHRWAKVPHRPTDRPTDCRTDRQTDRRTDRQTDRQTTARSHSRNHRTQQPQAQPQPRPQQVANTTAATATCGPAAAAAWCWTPEVAKPPIPALPEFSSKKEWTEGDGTTWWRWCEDLQDWVDEHLPGRRIGDRCRLATALIKGHLSEHGWAKSCAIQYEHLDVLGREPDPYMCE
jgi:hypothetical protein